MTLIVNNMPFSASSSSGDLPLTNGRYRIIRELGQGGMGTVFLVEDNVRHNEQIVLKILQEVHVKGQQDTFLRREFSTLANLRHPNLVKVFDFGKLNGTGDSYYTMELISGQPFLDAVRGLPPGEVILLITEILQALDYIHNSGIIHGDIKSENILVVANDKGKKVIKLLDFGLAALSDSHIKEEIGGTLEYFAPELFRGGCRSVQTDLYAVGVLMYWALIGHAPFSGTPDEIKQGHLTTLPKKIGDGFPGLSKNAILTVQGLLAKDPSERPASSADVLASLSEHNIDVARAGEFITARIWDAFVQIKSDDAQKLVRGILSALDKKDKTAKEVSPNHIVISGNEGSGHNLIADQVKHQLQLNGVPVYEGWCNTGLSSPFQPVMDAFKSHSMVYGGAENNGIEFLLANLSQMHSEQMSDKGSGIKDPELLRFKFMEAFTKRVAEACHKEPFVLLVRDIDLADDGTLELIHFMARALELESIVICVSVSKDRQSENTARLMQQQQNSIKAVLEQPVQSLSSQEIQLLLNTAFDNAFFPDKFYAELGEKSGGIPIVISDTLVELNAQGYYYRQGSRWVLSENYSLTNLVCSGLFDLYSKLYHRLSQAQREVAKIIAVYGSATSRQLLLEILRGSNYPVEQVIDGLVERRIIATRILGEEVRYNFLFDNFRDLVYSLIPAEESRNLHLLVVDAINKLCSESISIELKAYHYLKAEIFPQAFVLASQAVTWLKRAYAHRKALTIALRALAFHESMPYRSHRAFLRKAADMEEMLGETQSALNHFNDASLKYRRQVAKAAITRRIAALLQKTGEVDSARNVLINAYANLALSAKVESALLLRELAWLELVEGRYELAFEFCSRALGNLNSEVPSRPLALVLNAMGLACFYLGNFQVAIEHLNRSAKVKESFGDKRGEASTLNNLGILHNIVGHNDLALGEWRRSLDIRERIGDLSGIGETLNNLGIILMESGNYTEAQNYYRRSKDIGTRIGDVKNLLHVLCNLGELAYFRSDFSYALNELDEGLVYAERVHTPGEKAELLFQKARVFMALNQVEPAAHCIDQCLELAGTYSKKSRLGMYLVLKSRIRQTLRDKSSQQYLEQAELICRQEKEQILELELKAERLRQLVESGNSLSTNGELDSFSAPGEADHYRQYQVEILILHARAKMQKSEESADILRTLDSAEALAQSMRLLMQVKSINFLKGEVHRRFGRTAAAYDCYRKAFRTLKDMMAAIKEEEYKSSLLASRENVSLVEAIKSLRHQVQK
jgi:serine/threonine protein kinase/tetratricopeptide (TPR) repeat protein